jgi:hypothetical protein
MRTNNMSEKLFNFLTGLNGQRTLDGRTFMGPAVEEGGTGRVLEEPNIDLRGQGIPLNVYKEAKSTPGWPFVDDMLRGGGRVTAQGIGAEDGGKVTAQGIGAEDGNGGGKVTAQGIGAEDGAKVTVLGGAGAAMIGGEL